MSERVRLARVTGGLDAPRGLDVKHRVRVPSSWLDEGASLEFELPRNLACAKCDGGGCDLCGRSGAVTLRTRSELPEIVQITLPRRGDSAQLLASGRGVMLRIPERGGLPPEDGMPRGHLMLSVIAGDVCDEGVSRVDALAAGSVALAPSIGPSPAVPSGRRLVWIVAILVVLWIAALIVARVTGLG